VEYYIWIGSVRELLMEATVSLQASLSVVPRDTVTVDKCWLCWEGDVPILVERNARFSHEIPGSF
jgi:hypothetical protein